MPLANPNVAVAATQMEILTMAKKPTAKKQTKTKKTTVKKRTRKQAASKHGLAVADSKTQRRPAAKTTARKSAARKPSPAIKTKRVRVDGAIGALDEVLTGLGAERVVAIRARVRSILNSFR